MREMRPVSAETLGPSKGNGDRSATLARLIVKGNPCVEWPAQALDEFAAWVIPAIGCPLTW